MRPLGYILYTKKTAPYVDGGEDYWNVPARDSVKMDKLIKNGFQLLNVAKDDLFLSCVTPIKYCGWHITAAATAMFINWHDKYMSFEQSSSVVKNLCTAFKGRCFVPQRAK